jgi:hypothetical protein
MKIKKTLIKVLLKIVPDLIKKKLKRVLIKNISIKKKVIFPNNKEIYF